MRIRSPRWVELMRLRRRCHLFHRPNALARDLVTNQRENRECPHHDHPKPQAKARQEGFFLRDIDGNLNRDGMRRRRANRRYRRWQRERLVRGSLSSGSLHRDVLVSAARIAKDLILPPCQALSTMACFVHRAGEYRTVHIAAPPFPAQPLPAVRPNRQGVPAASCAARSACRPGTIPCSSLIPKPARNKGWPWPESRGSGRQAHTRRLTGRPTSATAAILA